MYKNYSILLDIDLLRFMGKRMNGNVTEIKGSRLVFISKINKVAGNIEPAAKGSENNKYAQP